MAFEGGVDDLLTQIWQQSGLFCFIVTEQLANMNKCLFLA